MPHDAGAAIVEQEGRLFSVMVRSCSDRIVRRAYQDIVSRDLDDGGLRQYRSRVIDDEWTEEQARQSMRSGPECRDKMTMTRGAAFFLKVMHPEKADQGTHM